MCRNRRPCSGGPLKALRLALPLATLVAAFFFASDVSFATKEMAKKEKKACTTCHPKGNMKQLNDVGKYYNEKKTLDGAPQEKK
jgi:hypothetical protein